MAQASPHRRCMCPSGWWCSRRPATAATAGSTKPKAFDHTAPLTVLINPVIEVVDPCDGRRLGGLSFGAGSARLGRAGAPHPLYRLSTPTAAGSCARPRDSMPAWSCTRMRPPRRRPLSAADEAIMKKLLFESEIQHWLEKQRTRGRGRRPMSTRVRDQSCRSRSPKLPNTGFSEEALKAAADQGRNHTTRTQDAFPNGAPRWSKPSRTGPTTA